MARTRRRAAATTSRFTAGRARPLPASRNMRSARGMTLIEIGVALCIAGLMLAVAIPAIGAVTRAQLRQKSGQLAGGVRSLYGAAAIAGRTCRLVLDLDGNAYWAECAKTNVRLSPEGERS